jgi:hypothetical protein
MYYYMIQPNIYIITHEKTVINKETTVLGASSPGTPIFIWPCKPKC